MEYCTQQQTARAECQTNMQTNDSYELVLQKIHNTASNSLNQTQLFIQSYNRVYN